MDVLTSETCWALNKVIIKHLASSWSFVTQRVSMYTTPSSEQWKVSSFISVIRLALNLQPWQPEISRVLGFTAPATQQDWRQSYRYWSYCEFDVQRRLPFRLRTARNWFFDRHTAAGCYHYVLLVDNRRPVLCGWSGLHPAADSSCTKWVNWTVARSV